jgi:hypothetical protein
MLLTWAEQVKVALTGDKNFVLFIGRLEGRDYLQDLTEGIVRD